jgi:hypothetical protein
MPIFCICVCLCIRIYGILPVVATEQVVGALHLTDAAGKVKWKEIVLLGTCASGTSKEGNC